MSSERSKVEVGPGEARYYDLTLTLISFGLYSGLIKGAIEQMHIEPGQAILDLGSGTGKNNCFMAEAIGSEGRIVGLDSSDEMLRIARERCHTYPQIQFQKQRIEEPIPYHNEFDQVFISFVLHGFEDNQKLKIMDNAFHALKPGGVFNILDYNQFDLADVWWPLRWIFIHGECELAMEFLELDVEKMLSEQGFAEFEEELFFRAYIRLLRAVKPS